MDPVIFVEVLGRIGEVLHRIPIDRFPASVGRAYDNDVIVDDPYVAPHHLKIDQQEDGTLIAADLATKNGLFTLHPTRKVTYALLHNDARLRIGHTQLRVRAAEHSVPPEERDPLSGGWQSASMFFVGLIAYVAVFGFLTFSSSFEEIASSAMPGGMSPAFGYFLGLLISGLPYALGVVGVWAGAWAIIGRLATGRAQFFAHGTLTLLAAITATVLDPLVKALSFAFSAPRLAHFIPVLLAAIGAVLLYRQLRFVSAQRRRVLASAAIAVSSLMLIASQVSEYIETREDVQSLDSTDILTLPALRVASGATIDQFVESMNSIERELRFETQFVSP